MTGFDPGAVGNGSSMRVGRWCRALVGAGGLEVVVVPTAGTTPSEYRRVALPDEEAIRRGAATLMSARWRHWMVRTAPLPHVAGRVPAWMGRSLLSDLPWRPDIVIAFKMALAPMAADLALECGVPLLVDLDDDEATLAATFGEDTDEAEALERLLRGVADLAAVLTVAAPADAESVGARVGVPVQVVPNTVALGPRVGSGSPGRAMYVANFDYAPNRVSARWLLHDVLPQVAGLAELSVVGALSDHLGCEAPAVAYGKVPDLTPFYADASVVLCPVLAGSGTSLKVLEALAHGRAVVTTSVGARGLDLASGEELVIIDDPSEFAGEVSRLLASPAASAALGARGRAAVEANYSESVGDTAIWSAVLAALAAT